MMTEIKVSHYLKVKGSNPDFIAAVEALGRAAKAGPLTEKTVQLVQMAGAAAIRSEGAVHSHVRRAMEAGAGADEIRQGLIALTSTIGFPSVMAALSWAEEVIGANLDKG
jgi:4-carboxymuconolactone decarboxylase